jgi:Rieske Fe-S protein
MEINRKEFLQTCGNACMGLLGISLFLQSCTPAQYVVNATVVNNQVRVNKNDFIKQTDKGSSFRKYMIVQPDNSEFPIVVYRKDEKTYTALLLKCTHQGYELSVNGDVVSCAAHGSEFSTTGDVLTGPAEAPLTRYNIATDDTFVYILLS